MPIFIDPIDPATPTGTDPRSQGDDRIREVKRGIIERLQVEHDFPTASGAGSGRHKFPFGNTASRPTDVAPGSLYFNTETGYFEQWDGVNWNNRAVRSEIRHGVNIGPVAYTGSEVAIITLPAISLAGSYLILSGGTTFYKEPVDTSDVLSIRVRVNGGGGNLVCEQRFNNTSEFDLVLGFKPYVQILAVGDILTLTIQRSIGSTITGTLSAATLIAKLI